MNAKIFKKKEGVWTAPAIWETAGVEVWAEFANPRFNRKIGTLDGSPDSYRNIVRDWEKNIHPSLEQDAYIELRPEPATAGAE